MAEFGRDLGRQVEDERVRVGGAHEGLRILGTEDRHACDVAAANEVAHQVELARRCARAVGVLGIGAEHAAFDDRDPLPAIQELRGALFDRIAVRIEQVCGDRGDDPVERPAAARPLRREQREV
jgi:hypothetical protein